MEVNHEDTLQKQLEQLLKVLAAVAVQGKSFSDGAQLLDRLGVDRALVAAIYGTSQGSVRGTLSQAKKASRKAARPHKPVPKPEAEDVSP